jgi:Predicted transcriptional regulators
MRTVKQVSDLTGISVRMLHYYDEIGLLKPSEVTDAGYRLYDDEALMILQQILFYKELDISLKEVKEILYSPHYNKMQALEKQKKLLILKCNRLNDLVELINKTLKGENTMSFTEFDMSEYFNTLEEFKKEHAEKIINAYGSMDKYNEFIEKCKSKEAEIAKMAVKQYGSIEKYVKAMKKNYNSNALIFAEQVDKFKKDCLEDKHPELKELFKELVSDLGKDPASMEIQRIAEEIKNTAQRDYEVFKTEMGNDYWYSLVQIYLLLPDWIKAVDEKYGPGASKFIGKALKTNLGDNQPKIRTLYEKLTSDLSKNPNSEEIQKIVAEIANVTQKQHENLKIDEGENYFGYMAELYMSDSIWKKATDKNYGPGASKFIGEALKFYSESSK